MNSNFIQNKHSFGHFFIYNKNKCFVLGDSNNNDFMVIKDLDEDVECSMYQESNRLNYQIKHIQNLTSTLSKKLYQPSICSFNLSSNQVSQIKQNSKDSTHIFFTTYDSNLVIGSLDIREDERIFDFLQLPYKVNTLTRKLVFTDTFHRVVSIDNYFVTISQGDFISFESVKNNHTIVLQEQQI
jgi:hypothetical protein